MHRVVDKPVIDNTSKIDETSYIDDAPKIELKPKKDSQPKILLKKENASKNQAKTAKNIKLFH